MIIVTIIKCSILDVAAVLDPPLEGIIHGCPEIAVLETIGNSLEYIYDGVASQ